MLLARPRSLSALALLLLCAPATTLAQEIREFEAVPAPEGAPPVFEPEVAPGSATADTGEPPWPRKGLMIAGWSTLGGSYLFTLMVAAQLMAEQEQAEAESTAFYTKECVNCEETAGYLIIPLVGPFLAIGPADGTDGKVVVTMMGLAQVAGLVMGIIGTSNYLSDRAAYRQWEQGRVALGEHWYLSGSAGAGRLGPGVALGASF